MITVSSDLIVEQEGLLHISLHWMSCWRGDHMSDPAIYHAKLSI